MHWIFKSVDVMKSNGTKVVLVILTCIITCLIEAKNYERCELRKIFLKAFSPEQINDCESRIFLQMIPLNRLYTLSSNGFLVNTL